MWIAGAALVALAVAAFYFMRHTKSELHTMIGTETLSIPELERFRGVSDELGAKGTFRKVAEVVGTAHPRPQGALKAELSKTECVWYRFEVERQYETVEYRDGKRRRTRRTEKVAGHTSQHGYAVIDDQRRTIGVDPNGTSPDRPEQTMDRFEPHRGGSGSMELFGISLPSVFGGGNSTTIGYRYKEWVIRPGRRLYVLGEVHDRIGPLVIGKPQEGGHFLISTRTEGELRADREKRHKLLAAGVIGGTLLGVVLIVAGIVS
ncbi:helicase [Prauserella marina]|uniref:RING-type E3 ubiquitin transferase n=1 Tax=Prauserella marina TaxID=530584 RepID=A0A222VJQ1_9PSEU|nr:E3 ubiquitin ligase family protein [Prauserella marina]ASR34156.1 helicase [Prauserella marina]PWV82805.1 E3 ubiquitin ligase [Prauserella marina]SDC77699.1 E3 Ubiquitin ligase [Prauserella marina]